MLSRGASACPYEKNRWMSRCLSKAVYRYFKWQISNVLNLLLAFCTVIASGGQRLRRPILRKGSAFPWRGSDFVPRLRLRLNRRGEASPKKALGSKGPEGQGLSVRQGGRAARDNQINCGNSRALSPKAERGGFPHKLPRERAFPLILIRWFFVNRAYNIRRRCEVLT